MLLDLTDCLWRLFFYGIYFIGRVDLDLASVCVGEAFKIQTHFVAGLDGDPIKVLGSQEPFMLVDF